MTSNQPSTLGKLTFETAEGHALTRVPTASPSSLAGEIRKHLAQNAYDSLTHVAILEGAELVGVLNTEDLFSAPEEAVVGEIMDPDPPVVAPGTNQEVAAWQAVKHEESALTVVDKEGNFMGFIPPHRLLAVLLWEHEEDMDRLGGFLRETRRHAVQARNRRDAASGTGYHGCWSVSWGRCSPPT